MTYFVTGATGFIGRRLVRKLLQRKGTVYVLLREHHRDRLDILRAQWQDHEQQVQMIAGDLTQANLGVSEQDQNQLRGNVKHFFHLAAIYDLNASAEQQRQVNIDGTQHALDLADTIQAGCFHHTSSIAAAGRFEGVFREDMFEEAGRLDHPYFRTKHDSEGLVRQACQVPWRIYRPAMVVGSSIDGQMDKIDGPYYFFKLLQKLRRLLPPWVPVVGLEGGYLNLVPVNFVVDAMDYLAHLPDQDGQCFHLTDPNPKRLSEAMSILAKAAHAPAMPIQINTRLFEYIPQSILMGMDMLPPVKKIKQQTLKDLGIPADVFGFLNWAARFDCRHTTALLEGSGISVPPFESYAWKLWDYWERHLDPELFIDRSLRKKIVGKNILLTGASSGIGKATALKLAEAGGRVLLVARGEDKLRETQQEMAALGGEGVIYTADVSDLDSCDDLVKRVVAQEGGVDVLINCAGRSIRRSVTHALDRFHDFERTMQLNYFGCLRLILGFLPTMEQRGGGHIINISSISTLVSPPRFSAYVASKAALEGFSRCAGHEYADKNITFTNVNMPLVRTPMVAPTKVYDNLPLISPEQAADLVLEGLLHKSARVATRLGIVGQITSMVMPRFYQTAMNQIYHLFPESAAAMGKKELDQKPSAQQAAFASLTQGMHW